MKDLITKRNSQVTTAANDVSHKVDGTYSESGAEDSPGVYTGSKKISKNEKRLIQNRVSAQRFRQKRKNEFETLKENLNSVLQENEILRNQVQELNAILKHQQELHAAQEVQMQAIQSSLMEIFCKQVLTQQGVLSGGNTQGSSQINTQSLAQNMMSMQQTQSASAHQQANNFDSEGNGEFMRNLGKLLELQNQPQSMNPQSMPLVKQDSDNFYKSSNKQNNIANLLQGLAQTQKSSNGYQDKPMDGSDKQIPNSIVQAIQNLNNGFPQDNNNQYQNSQILQQLQQKLGAKTNGSSDVLMRPQNVSPILSSGFAQSPLLKPDDNIFKHTSLKKQCSQNVSGALTPRGDTPFKAKMAQPVVLVNDQSPKSKVVTPKGKDGNNILDSLISQVKTSLHNGTTTPYRDRSLSQVSGIATPMSNFGGASQQNQLNISQITQLLKNAQQANGNQNSGDSDTRDNSRKDSKMNSGIMYSNLNNCFSFNNLIKNNIPGELKEQLKNVSKQNNHEQVSRKSEISEKQSVKS